MSEERYKTAKELVTDFKDAGLTVSYDHVRNLMRIAPCTLGGRFARYSELLTFWRSLPGGTNVRSKARAPKVELGRITTL